MAEGPAFDRDGVLYVANCRANFVSRVSRSGEVSHFVTTGGKTQGVAIQPDGAFLVTDFLERKIFRVSPEGRIEGSFGCYQDGSPLRGPNEITLGPNGQVYFTDPGNAWRGRATGAIARLGSDGRAEVLADNLEFTNGMDFSPDGHWLYVAESTSGKILRAPLASDGRLASALGDFVRFPGRVGPDGIRFSATGDLYVALFGQGLIAVVGPDGAIVDQLRVPGLFPTNVIFDGTELLVCEGQTGSIWSLSLGVEGLRSFSQRVWNTTRSA
jgi:gluconolactonase